MDSGKVSRKMKQGGKRRAKPPMSLLLVEGETDEIFYRRIKSLRLSELRCTVKNLEGLYNINQKVVDRIFRYLQEHKDEKIRVYSALTESPGMEEYQVLI